MVADWQETELGNVITLQRGFDLPTQKRKPGFIPIISSSGLSGRNSEARVPAPGVVTGRYGTIGEVFYIEEDFWPLNTTLFVKDFKGNDPHFIFYLLKTLNYYSCSDKSSVPGVNRNDLHRLRVSVPSSVTEQKAIAGILGALDYKIDLNSRMNQTLEAMIRAIFRSWFVDFDPVRAKAEGHKPVGMDPVTAALFPESFEDSSLGKIPKGYRTASLGDLCRRVAMGPFGSNITTDNFVDAGVPVIRGGNLTHGFIDENFAYVSEEKANELRNANAFPADIVITHRGTLGQVGVIPTKSAFPRYVVSQSQLVLSADSNLVTSRFLFEYLCSAEGQHQLLANTSQTGVPAIARPVTSIKAIRIILPPLNVLHLFESRVKPLVERSIQNLTESRTLAHIRDALLPKLISGELRCH
jgi:type I restriction enzyme, S subunit